MNNGFDWKTGDWLIGSGALPGACSELGKAPCIPGQGDLSEIPNGNHIRVNPKPYLYSAREMAFSRGLASLG
jgi:hypothetical protein